MNSREREIELLKFSLLPPYYGKTELTEHLSNSVLLLHVFKLLYISSLGLLVLSFSLFIYYLGFGNMRDKTAL